MFFTLYFCMTGLHAIHVLVGTGVLGFLLVRLLGGHIDGAASHPLAIGAIDSAPRRRHLDLPAGPSSYLIPGVR